MNKAWKICLIVVTSLIALLALAWLETALAYNSADYANRIIANLWDPTGVKDYAKFTSREIKNSSPVFNFKKQLNEDMVNSMFVKAGYMSGGKEMQIQDLDTFLKTNSTTSFIVIKDDTILYEKYFNGYQRDSICTSFSVAKSFDSTLMGLAIEDGYIKSVNEPIINYLPELNRDGLGAVTIRNLLTMSSGIHYAEAYASWGDDALT